jgi:hypothetical protein
MANSTVKLVSWAILRTAVSVMAGEPYLLRNF